MTSIFSITVTAKNVKQDDAFLLEVKTMEVARQIFGKELDDFQFENVYND